MMSQLNILRCRFLRFGWERTTSGFQIPTSKEFKGPCSNPKYFMTTLYHHDIVILVILVLTFRGELKNWGKILEALRPKG